METEMTPQTLVIKIGSAVLMQDRQRMDRAVFCQLIAELAQHVEQGHRAILVSSGAVATGRRKMNLERRPSGERNIPKLQALAALGQSRLIQMYESEFSHYSIDVAQILLTRDDFNNRRRYLNARNTLRALYDFGALAIINENDTVTTEEIRFGDNDQLAAMVAAMIGADALILLSDVDGLYTSNPHADASAKHLPEVQAQDPMLDEMVGGTADPTHGFGTGGMRTKLAAARIAAQTGIPTIIGPGKRPGILQALLQPNPTLGTRLLPPQQIDHKTARKVWISTGLVPQGRVWCDRGAVDALCKKGTSLLARGIANVEGEFQEGDAVELLTPGGEPFARGLTLYPSTALRAIMGKHSSSIEEILGYRVLDAVIHRDDLALLTPHQSTDPTAAESTNHTQP